MFLPAAENWLLPRVVGRFFPLLTGGENICGRDGKCVPQCHMQQSPRQKKNKTKTHALYDETVMYWSEDAKEMAFLMKKKIPFWEYTAGVSLKQI